MSDRYSMADLYQIRHAMADTYRRRYVLLYLDRRMFSKATGWTYAPIERMATRVPSTEGLTPKEFRKKLPAPLADTMLERRMMHYQHGHHEMQTLDDVYTNRKPLKMVTEPFIRHHYREIGFDLQE